MTRDHEHLARARKAAAIAEVLRAHDGTSVEAEALNERGREMAEILAGTHRPASEETWKAVVAILRGGEKARTGDAFAGLPGGSNP